MRVLAVVSENPSHADFGGFGYVSLARRFRDRGHAVCWLSGSARVRELAEPGMSGAEFPLVVALRHDSPGAAQAAQGLLQAIRLVQADVVLCDRFLTAAPAAARQAGVPLVAVGTPGGRWQRTAFRGMRGVAPVASTRPSFWIDQADAFVTFMPRSFYGGAVDASALSVGHAGMRDRRSLRDPGSGRVTVLLGSGEPTDALVAVLAALPAGLTLDVFHRTDPAFVESAGFRALIGIPGAVSRGWADLASALRPSLYSVSLGGIGSIWASLAVDLPVLVCPAGWGDQAYNAHRVETAGLGAACFPDASAERVRGCHDAMLRVADRDRLVDEADFDHDLDSAVEAIVSTVS